MIWLSQMFTWVVKKCLNLTFKVNFHSQKLYESFWCFFSLKNISLGAGFLLLTFFKNFYFWTTLFSNMGPNFWRSVWKSVKVKSKNYFHFNDFFAKIYSMLTHICKTPLLRSHYNRILFSLQLKNQSRSLYKWPCLHLFMMHFSSFRKELGLFD